jgi:aspartate kinase
LKIIVQKYGGTSVGSVEKIKNVADRIIANKNKGYKLVVIVSAMGDFTDELVSLAKQIEEYPSGREYDALLATGESISSSLLAMSLIKKGHEAISLTGWQAGVYTESIYNKAKILDVKPARILEELSNDKIVIVNGFQGINSDDDITTIGRGGSDTSAVAIASSLKAEFCEIYTDVDGVYTTNPNLIKEAKKHDIIDYDEMLELASLGAQVLHPRAVEGAKLSGIKLVVRSSYNNNQGTIVKEILKMEIKNPITGIAYDENTSKIAIKGLPDKPGIAGKLFSVLAKEKINVDMIVQSSQTNYENDIAFTVSQDEFLKSLEITNDFAKELGAKDVSFKEHVSKISIVGVGMVSSPGVAAKMFSLLGENDINIDLIATSEIKVSCIIDKKETKKAVQLLHSGFNLDS